MRHDVPVPTPHAFMYAFHVQIQRGVISISGRVVGILQHMIQATLATQGLRILCIQNETSSSFESLRGHIKRQH